jgi:hypothetical protein
MCEKSHFNLHLADAGLMLCRVQDAGRMIAMAACLAWAAGQPSQAVNVRPKGELGASLQRGTKKAAIRCGYDTTNVAYCLTLQCNVEMLHDRVGARILSGLLFVPIVGDAVGCNIEKHAEELGSCRVRC